MIKRTIIIEIVTVLNIIIFLYTAIAKIMDYAVFKEQLAISPILGLVAQPIAILLPWVEFAVVLLLVIPRWRLKGLYVSFSLMTGFTVYILSMFLIDTKLPCNCGGIIELLSWKQHLLFNIASIFLNAVAIRLQQKEKRKLSKGWLESTGYRVTHG